MVRDEQVRLLRTKMDDGDKQQTAAAQAGMSVRTARKWQRGALPSESKQERHWRTRADPFAEVWEADIVPLLAADERGVLEAATLIELLQERHPGDFLDGQVRTLQRRLRDWRAEHGPARTVSLSNRSGGIDARPTALYISSNTGLNSPSAVSTCFLSLRSGCFAGTTVSGDIRHSIDACFLSVPRMNRDYPSP